MRFVPFDSHGRLGMQAIRELKAIGLRDTGGVVNNVYAKCIAWMIDNITTAHKRAIGARLMAGRIAPAKEEQRDSRWGSNSDNSAMTCHRK